MSRQTRTGSAQRASHAHGTCSTSKPVAPFVKIVPENSRLIGTSPASSACR